MSTFIDLTNQTLRRLNEVELTTSNFANVRGFQSHAKDAVNSAISEIHQTHYQWPFNHNYVNITLEVGKQEYEFPSDIKYADWNSFFIDFDESIESQGYKLYPLEYIDWLKFHKANDQRLDEDNYSVPRRVVRLQSVNEFIISPVPNKEYSLNYEYWSVPDKLVNHDDETTIPSEYDHVIVDGAVYYTYLFRENFESAQLIFNSFRNKINKMRYILIPPVEYIQDTRHGRQFIHRRRY